jgi:Xaa-Pro aminopeptidase
LTDIAKIQKAIREENLDGWLFCNFRRRDPLSDAILERPAGLTNSRLWLYAVPAGGQPLAVVHAIEAGHLEGLPGVKQSYVSREELRAALAPLAGKRWGAHFSPALTAVSFLDAGTAAFLESAGLTLVPAESLVQRFKSLLDREGIASHRRAAAALYDIVRLVWEKVKTCFANRSPLYEGDLRGVMEDEFKRRSLTRDHPPLAAAGANTADPHYDFEGKGAQVKEGDVIQLDLWAKEQDDNAIYADISWVGYYGREVPAPIAKTFADLRDARDKTVAFIKETLGKPLSSGTQIGVSPLSGGSPLSGAEVDAYTRSLLIGAGYEKALKHRTGHGIDTEVHGSGVNIDSVEFPDNRLLLEGACFSIEPGIYVKEYGLRTELDVYIEDGSPRYYGELQAAILTC